MGLTKNRFRIGDFVHVMGELVISNEYVRDSTGDYQRRIARRELPPDRHYSAVVTGAGTRFEGRRVRIGPEEGSSFETSKAVQVWLVRQSTCSAEQAVFEDDLMLLNPVFYPRAAKRCRGCSKAAIYLRRQRPIPGEPKLPWRLGGVMIEADRSFLRKLMADWPRARDGRWRKAPAIAFPAWLRGRATEKGPVGELARWLIGQTPPPPYVLGDFRARLEVQGLLETHGTTLKEAWLMWFDSADVKT